MRPRFSSLAVSLLCLSFLSPRSSLLAQFYAYPSFQPPRTTPREYNFAYADSRDNGTSLIFQWRERVSDRMHLQFDAGFADPSAQADARLVIGGGVARSLRLASDEVPLDLAITAGAGGSFGGGTSFLRVPVGLSVGHRFPMSGAMALTPYAHPRLSVDFCSRCGGSGRHDTTLGVDVDLGVSAEFSQSIGVRASLLFAGSDFYGRGNAFGVSLAWTPLGLK